MSRVAALIFVFATGFRAVNADAQELSGNCTVGSQVTNRSDKTGTVTASSGGYCNVKYPDGTTGYHPSFMLRLAGTSRVDAADVAVIKPGKYNCYAGSPLQYTFVDINVRNASAYADGKGKTGAFRYDPKSQLITFTSGPFEGQYAKYLGKQRIGIASKPTTYFATVCNLK